MEDILKETAKGAGIILFGFAIGYSIKYISYILLARFLGPTSYGLFALGLAILGIFTSILMLGFDNGIPALITAHKTDEERRGLVRAALIYSVTLSVITAIVLISTSNLLAQYVFHDAALNSVIPFFALMIPFAIIINISLATMRGLKEFKYKVYINDISLQIVPFVIFLVLFYFGFGLYAALIAYLVGYFLTALLSFILALKKINIFDRSKNLGLRLLSFSWPLLLSGVLALILHWTDTLMLGVLKNSELVGLYNAALPTALSMSVLLYSANFVFIPLASGLFAEKKIEDMKTLYKSVTKWIFMIAFPIFLLIIVFPEQVLRMLFGEAYTVGALALSILAAGALVNTVMRVADSVLIVIGKTKLLLISGIFASVINVILIVSLIPAYGMVGAAIGTSLSLILSAVIVMVVVYANLKIFPLDFKYIKYAFSAIIAAAVVYIPIKLIFKTIVPVWTLIPGFGIFLLLYAFIFLVTRSIDKHDVVILRYLEHKTGIRIGFLRNFVKKFI